MNLPQHYPSLSSSKRREVRNEYVRVQGGKCHHCNEPLSGAAAVDVLSRPVNLKLFPEHFFNYPCHLHHDHDTGMTIGAVHSYCNAVLWQYHGE